MQWKQIEGYNYEVSTTGAVRNLSTGQILSPSGRYPKVTLSNEHGSIQVHVHTLVATAFIPNPLNLPMVNHKDEDKNNSDVSNLEWCDAVYNATYSFGKPVQQLYNGEVVAEHSSVNEAARAVDGKACQISRCCNKVKGCHKHRSFEWRFKDGRDN